MTVESQASKSAEPKTVDLKPKEANLCDVNSQLCDGDIHTVPLDLDIPTTTAAEKESMMSKVTFLFQENFCVRTIIPNK